MSTTITTGKVKYSAREPKDYGYGLKINAVVTLADGTEIKLWGKPDSPIGFLQKGQSVTLVKDAKGNYQVADRGDTATDAPIVSSGTIPNDRKTEIAGYVGELAKLYGFCLDTAKAQCADRLDGDIALIKDVATTLFIATQRKYSL